jgi:hypothetical protein
MIFRNITIVTLVSMVFFLACNSSQENKASSTEDKSEINQIDSSNSVSNPIEWFQSFDSSLFSQKIIEVKNFNEFYNALGNNRTIVLLNEIVMPKNLDIPTKDIQFSFNSGLNILGLSNLKITTKDGKKIAITQPNPSYRVINFEKCENIRIENVVAGHKPKKGGCSASVFSFGNSKGIFITNSDLYGSGFNAISAIAVSYLMVDNSIFRECSANMFELNDSKFIFFNKLTIKDNKENNNSGVAYLSNVDSMVFKNSLLTGNISNKTALFMANRCGYIIFENLSISNNKAQQLINDPEAIIFRNLELKENSWQQDNNPI